MNAIDIILISETHFTDKSYCFLPNYELFQANHSDGTAHGGAAILIKDTIHHYELPKYVEHHMQASSIKITSLPYSLNIPAVYYPPRHNLKQIYFQIFLHTLGPKFIAGGDFNTKHTAWGSRLLTTKGRELYRAIHDNNYLTISLGTPTYWHTDANKIPDLLDFFITNSISENYVSVTGSYDLSSDHTPIIATIRTSLPLRQPQPRLHNCKTNWEHFRTILESTIQATSKLKHQMTLKLNTTNTSSYYKKPPKGQLPCLLSALPQQTSRYGLKNSQLPGGEPDPPGKGLKLQSTEPNVTNSAIN
jgi:hypothetical protein